MKVKLDVSLFVWDLHCFQTLNLNPDSSLCRWMIGSAKDVVSRVAKIVLMVRVF